MVTDGISANRLIEKGGAGFYLLFFIIFASNLFYMPLIHEYELTIVTENGIEPIIPFEEAMIALGIKRIALRGLIFGTPKRGGAKLRAVILTTSVGDKGIHIIVDDNFREVQQYMTEEFLKKNRNTKVKKIRRVKDILKEIRGK